jgi:hypothetical protein
LDGVGRVADVEAADFNGDGKLDLIVGVFGWTRTGEIIYLENHTTDWSQPVFARYVLDDRHGTIHVPVCDLNKDGRPDFVELIEKNLPLPPHRRNWNQVEQELTSCGRIKPIPADLSNLHAELLAGQGAFAKARDVFSPPQRPEPS